MPFVQSNGLRLHTVELGSGPPLFLVHGLLIDNLASWFFTAAPALARMRRVVLHDLRGHGLSDPADSGYGTAVLCDDLEQVVEARAPGERFDLGGASFGALVGLRYALRHPGRVRRLVLVEAPLPPRRFLEIEPMLKSDLPTLLKSLPGSIQKDIRTSPRRARRFASSVERLVTRTSLLPDLRREEKIPDADLAGLDLPVLCLYGSRSPCLPDGEALAAALPDARLKVLDGGHGLLRDVTAEVTTEMEAFLRG